MRKLAGLLVLAAFSMAACGGKDAAKTGATAPGAGGATTAGSPASSGAMAAKSPSGAGKVAAATPGDFDKRAGELSNPNDETMVFLYHDLTGIPVPVDRWVEADSKVSYAQPVDRAAAREEVKAGIVAGAASVKGVGLLHLTMNANISDYDPTYGEFTIRAFAPNSSLAWRAFGEEVALKFGNGRQAETWSVPVADAQAIRDHLSAGPAEVDALLRIKHVLPGSGGGEIVADVVSYELRRTDNGGATLARVTVTK